MRHACVWGGVTFSFTGNNPVPVSDFGSPERLFREKLEKTQVKTSLKRTSYLIESEGQ